MLKRHMNTTPKSQCCTASRNSSIKHTTDYHTNTCLSEHSSQDISHEYMFVTTSFIPNNVPRNIVDVTVVTQAELACSSPRQNEKGDTVIEKTFKPF